MQKTNKAVWGGLTNSCEKKRSKKQVQISSVQSLSRVWLFATPWIAVRQASLSITNSWSSLRLMSIESVMPSSHLILCRPLSSCPQSLPASESFPMSQLFAWGGQSIGVSALASFLPKNTQGWSPLEWTGFSTVNKYLLTAHYVVDIMGIFLSTAVGFKTSPSSLSIPVSVFLAMWLCCSCHQEIESGCCCDLV